MPGEMPYLGDRALLFAAQADLELLGSSYPAASASTAPGRFL